MPIAGKGGSVSWGGSTVGYVTEWSLDIGVDMLEITSLGKDWKEYISGLREWTGSMTVKFDTSDTAQTALRTALLDGTSASISLKVDATRSFSGTAFLSGGSISVNASDPEEMSFDFTGSGALTYS